MNIPSFFFTYLLVFILGRCHCVLFLRFLFREMQHLKSVYVWNGARDYPNGVYRGPCSLYVICLISSSSLFLFRLGTGEKGQVHWKKDCYLSTGCFLYQIPSRQYFLPHGLCTGASLKSCLKYQIRFNFNWFFLNRKCNSYFACNVYSYPN